MPCHGLLRAIAKFAARCMHPVVAVLCLAAPGRLDAQWPQELAENVERPAPLFRAAWSNGERTIERLGVSQDSGEPFEFASKSMAPAARSLRWLRSTRLVSKGPARSGIQFFGDDFLPGVVAGLSSQSGAGLSGSETFLVVAADQSVATSSSKGVAVRSSWIKKIIWRPRERDDYQPGHAFFPDGRNIEFRALHWTPAGVRLLQNDKIENIAFVELSELHLPDQDPWQTQLRSLACLTPECRGRLFQIESATGGRITASSSHIRRWDDASWIMQPAWASDGITVTLGDLQRVTCYDPHEFPLTRLQPMQVTPHGYVLDDRGQIASRDAAVFDTLSRSGGKDYAWSLSLRAPLNIDFLLPSAARRVEALVGIDERAGDGGCARGHLQLLAADRAIARSSEGPVLQGSRSPPARVSLDVPTGAKQGARVRLVADSQAAKRPTGADPLEIRDFIDWLEPLVVLDKVQLAREVRQAWPAALGPLADWSLDGDWQPGSQWRPGGRPRPGFRQEITLGAEPFRISRELNPANEHHHLSIYVSRIAGRSSPIDMRLSIEGHEVARREVPIDEQLDEPARIIVDLSAYIGRTVRLEISFRRRGESAAFELLGAALSGPP